MHCTRIVNLAIQICTYRQIDDMSNLTLEEDLNTDEIHQKYLQAAINVVEKHAEWPQLKCLCEAHQWSANTANVESKPDLYRILKQFQLSAYVCKDQSGANIMIPLMEFIDRRHRLNFMCYSKCATLQTSCAIYNTKNNSIRLYNSTPDFGSDAGQTIAVGEVESSPFVQLVVGSIGHLSDRFLKYMLGISLLKKRAVELYMIKKDEDVAILCDEVYDGPLSFRKIGTSVFDLTNVEGFTNCLQEISSVLKFILEDYNERLIKIEKQC